jgi:hypothetical protein
MALELGNANAVRRILNKTNTAIDDATTGSYIQEAIRVLKSKYYTWFMLDKFFITTVAATGTANRVYQTYFPMNSDSTLVKVYHNGALKTVTTDYTVDTSNSTITLSDDLTINDGEVLAIFYCPDFFDDYVNYLAAKRIIDRGLIDLPEGTTGQAIYNNIKETMKEYEDMVKTKPYLTSFRDHREDNAVF